MSHLSHREKAKKELDFYVVTVSTSRYTMKTESEKYKDESGDIAEEIIKSNGHRVVSRLLVSDDKRQITEVFEEFMKSSADVIIFAGGTGVSARDITVETLRPYFEKEIEGYGELVRMLGYKEIGPAAILTRATAGIREGKLIVCLPGSPNGVKLALENTISEFPHIIYVART
jgi:molybdenum cofactor biosynthesis protein B